MKNQKYIGVDIGGTTIKAALFNNEHEFLDFVFIKTNTKLGKKEVLMRIIRVIDELICDDVVSIGVGCPGPFKNLKEGILGDLNNLPLKNVKLKELLKNRFNIPVQINNDANCFTLAESKLGKGQNYSSVLGITLGTGIGTGLVINNKIYSGKGNALEFSGAKINNKTVENILGKKSIIKLAKKYKIKIKEPKELYAIAKDNKSKYNKLAKLAWKEFGIELGKITSILIQTLDPEIIVIGGQISNAWPYFSKSMQLTIKKNISIPAPKIVKTTNKASGVIGASLLSL